jgi:hypothetical protein
LQSSASAGAPRRPTSPSRSSSATSLQLFESGPSYWKPRPIFWVGVVVSILTIPLGIGFVIGAILGVVAFVNWSQWSSAPETLRDRADRCYRAGSYGDAYKLYDQYEKKRPGDAVAMSRQVVSNLKRSMEIGAFSPDITPHLAQFFAQGLEKVVRMAPNDPIVNRNHCYVLHELALLGDALAVIAEEDGTVKAETLQAMRDLALGDKAIAAMETAAQIDPAFQPPPTPA